MLHDPGHEPTPETAPSGADEQNLGGSTAHSNGSDGSDTRTPAERVAAMAEEEKAALRDTPRSKQLQKQMERYGIEAIQHRRAMDELFDSTPKLRHIRDAAISRNRSPIAVLCAVLARVSTSAGPNLLLPPVVGAPASLNLLVCVAGGTGGAKSTSYKMSQELLPVPDLYEGVIGTGEGLISIFLGAKPDKTTQELPRIRDNAFISVDEYHQMEQQGKRPGSTLGSILRSMAMGELVGNGNADPARRRKLDSRSYRLGLVMGVQPKLAGGLLNAEETAAGTPQRFLWTGVDKPNIAPGDRPEHPGPLPWTPYDPVFTVGDEQPDGTIWINYPDEVADHIIELDMEVDGDESASHNALLRLKVAAALAMLDERYGEFSMNDWERAGVIVDYSNRIQKECREAVSEHRRSNEVGAALAQHEIAEYVDVVQEQKTLSHCKERVIEILQQAEAPMSTKALKDRLSKPQKAVLAKALQELLEAGAIQRTEGRKKGSSLWSI